MRKTLSLDLKKRIFEATAQVFCRRLIIKMWAMNTRIIGE
jgi:hypothetical protein